MGTGRIAVVTGGSSGIGRECARFLSEQGLKVYELSRRNIPFGNIIHISADVSEEEQVIGAVSQILKEEGRIDILVTCAGFGISGAVEFTSLADAKRQLDVNFFGTVNCVKAVLPSMRKQGKGRIVCVSSVAGTIPIPFQAYYSVSKAAINSYAAALANEIRPYGISVCAVEPGDISSNFTDARKRSEEGDKAYGGRISRSVAVMEKDERNGMHPETAGRYIGSIALKKNVKPACAIGFKYKFFCVLMRIIPCRLSNYLLYLIYAR